jgi:epoxyqueuosine reductase
VSERKESMDISEWVEFGIRSFVASSENGLGNDNGEPYWGAPLIGFSSGADPLYSEVKRLIGPFYWEPIDIFKASFPGVRVSPEELTVIAWVLPQTRVTKMDNRKETRYPARRWARSRKFGEEFNAKLRAHIVSLLNGGGIEAVAPQLSPLWELKVSERYGLSSTWSERHGAHISGLGTFGLCDGLITPLGKAIRCGSVVARFKAVPTPRPYKGVTGYCLFLARGTCGKCMERCPAGAITPEGHNKVKCLEYIDSAAADYAMKHYGVDTHPCGLCQTKVPCESRIPAVKTGDREKEE